MATDKGKAPVKFFDISYQIYQQSWQKLGTFLENKVLQKMIKIKFISYTNV